MVGTLLVVYFVGWVAASLAAHAIGKRLAERHSPAVHPLVLSVVAGALWPLLLVGLVEFSSVMVMTKVDSKLGDGIGIYA
jgi:hypothetical protein